MIPFALAFKGVAALAALAGLSRLLSPPPARHALKRTALDPAPVPAPAPLPAPAPSPALQQEPAPAPAFVGPPRPPRARRSQDPRARTLSSLLDELDTTWLNLARTDVFARSLSRHDAEGLRRMGPLVLPKTMFRITDKEEETVRHIDETKGMPSMMFVALNAGDYEPDEPDAMAPDFFFALKVNKVPWTVTRMKGQNYRIGMAWRKGNGELDWGSFWASVHNGEVVPAFELHDFRERVGYTRRAWRVSSWRSREEDAAAAESVKRCFSTVLSTYQRRADLWNVSVKKNGRRAIFLVEPLDTAYFFKDRERHVTARGTTKRIMHFVHRHDRHYKDGRVIEVPEHIRGERLFTWKGYDCAVTSPRFHTFTALDFEVAGHDSGEDKPLSKYADAKQVAAMIAAQEDEHNVRRKHRLPQGTPG